MMISHFINQILFSFLEQRAIPSLPLSLPLPHLAAYTFIPRGTAAASEGTRHSRYNFRENGHITQLRPTGFPAGICSHRAVLYGAMFPVARRLVWEWGNNSLKREGERGRERACFRPMSNQGRTAKIYGSCEDEGDRSGGKVENGVNRCVGGEMVMATDADGWINDGCGRSTLIDISASLSPILWMHIRRTSFFLGDSVASLNFQGSSGGL